MYPKYNLLLLSFFLYKDKEYYIFCFFQQKKIDIYMKLFLYINSGAM